MDYEKKDSENTAVKTIMRMIADGEISQEVAEKYFPELKESDDEKTIKEIKQFVRSRGMSLAQSKVDSWLAWLEKQGEQKSANWFQELEDKLANATPQQLAEWREKYFREEPAEWSEKDEINLEKAIWYVENPAPMVVKDSMLVEWLKSLKNRVQPQPKQEWSEEDRKMMRNIIDDIHCGTNFNPKVMHAANEREKWFKSICMRYQSKWKPSDEQMEALKEQCVNLKSTHSGSILCELYNKLKKL